MQVVQRCVLGRRGWIIGAVMATLTSGCGGSLPGFGGQPSDAELAAEEAVQGEHDPAPAVAATQSFVWVPQASQPFEWSFGGVKPEVFWPADGGMGIRAPAEPDNPDVVLRSPQLDIRGAEFTILKVELECVVPAELNDLTVYYSTSSHGEAQEFRAWADNREALAQGERRVLTYNMAQLRMGGTDWVDSTIEKVRFDFPQGANSEYVLHSIKLCAPHAVEC